jgi:Fur family transcriptional regulator, ferric uptake regulator
MARKIKKDLCEPEKILKDCHLKLTGQRLEILKVIISNSLPFSIQDIKNKLKKNIDLVTIYRFIDILNGNNLISEVYNSEGTRYFELSCIHNPNHPHFICKKCGKIYCIKDFLIEKDLEINKNMIKNYQVSNISINLSGICNSCL